MKLPSAPLVFLWYYVKAFKWRFTWLISFILVWALNEALFPYFIKLLVEGVSQADRSASLWTTFRFPILGIACSWIIMEICMRLYGLVEIYLFPSFKAKMREDTFDWVKEQSFSYFTSNLAGSIGAKIADIPESSERIMQNVLWYVIAICLVFISSLVVIAQVSLVFTFLIIIWCLVHMGLTIYFQPEISQKTSIHYQALTQLNGETVDIVTNALSMKLFSRVPYESERLRHFQTAEINKFMPARWALEKVNFLRGFFSLCFIFVTVYLLLKGWQEGWISLGDFPLIAMTSFNLIGHIWQMSLTLLDIFRDMGMLNGALSLLREQRAVKDVSQALNFCVTKGEIKFENVTFGYRKRDPLFSNLSVHIKAGEKIGLVGFSGSGKTTFVNIILRAYDLTNGQILIDGQNIAEVTQSSLREQITLIPQDTSLFHRSVKENLAYGDLNATDEEIEEAARKACAHEFIQKLEQGYDTVVGERGLKLSGGQRQRLAIARAFLKNTQILILDEATSALDSETEKDIQTSLVQLMTNKTTLIVAHRLSTLKHMDRILVFDKGRIVEEGSQAYLLEKGGYFAHLWSLQHEGFLPDKK